MAQAKQLKETHTKPTSQQVQIVINWFLDEAYMCYLYHYIRAADSAPLPSDQKSTKKKLFILNEAPRET